LAQRPVEQKGLSPYRGSAGSLNVLVFGLARG
jgi:hypothetical protein